MTLTTRVSVFFLAALGFALIGFSTTIWLVARSQLWDEAFHQRSTMLDSLTALVERQEDGLELDMEGRSINFPPRDSGLDPAWSIIADGKPIGGFQPAGFDWADKNWLIGELDVQTDRIESPLPGWYRRIDFKVAVPLSPIDSSLQHLALLLLTVSSAIWIIAALLGRRYCRRALQPLAALTIASESFSGNDPTTRLPVQPAGDEIAGLALAFNGVLDRLQQAQERQNRFVAEASHQLRTPLTRLTGHLEVALRKARSDEEYRKTIARALDQTCRMTDMVEALLHLARPPAEGLPLEAVKVDLAELVCELVETWKHDFPSGNIQYQRPIDPIRAEVHSGLLRQAIDNLIDNAFKYSPPGTPVEIEVKAADGFTEIRVIDRGPGIPPAEREHLFQPFQRGERPREAGINGIGLGLAVCRRIVRNFGGDVTLEDGSEGCCFRIRLPSLRSLQA